MSAKKTPNWIKIMYPDEEDFDGKKFNSYVPVKCSVPSESTNVSGRKVCLWFFRSKWTAFDKKTGCILGFSKCRNDAILMAEKIINVDHGAKLDRQIESWAYPEVECDFCTALIAHNWAGVVANIANKIAS